jgi:hypothetical protein
MSSDSRFTAILLPMRYQVKTAQPEENGGQDASGIVGTERSFQPFATMFYDEPRRLAMGKFRKQDVNGFHGHVILVALGPRRL